MAHTTRHMTTRMNQRGITQDLVDLALKYGECQHDKYVLTRRRLEQILAALRQTERTVIRALDKGGVVVVEDGGQLITTYTTKSYDRRHARAYVRDRTW
jgi:hypothetical protein